MTAVMRREFGTAELSSSEVELGRGRANGLVLHVPRTMSTLLHVPATRPTRSLLAFCMFLNLRVRRKNVIRLINYIDWSTRSDRQR